MSQRCVEDAGRIALLSAQIRSGALTATALLERQLARIDAVEPSVQAWRLVARDSARAEAAALDRDAAAGRFRGKLHGIPVGIKDIIDVAGLTTLANSRSRADIAPASADAEIVARLRLAGAVILGKTHTTEFAFFDPSPARNPHNTDHTPGGSSSGSAAAVAAGMVPLALGTQTVASVNRPAAYCGIAAFKPTTQSNCTYGVVPLAPMFDTIGFYGTTVPDAIALWDAVTAPDGATLEDQADQRPREIVRLVDAALDACDPDITRAVSDAVARLAGQGHRVRELRAPDGWADLFESQIRAMQYEAGRVHRALLDAPADRVGPKLREMLAIGLAVSDDAYRSARQHLADARERLWATLSGVDAVLFPATPKTAPAGLASTGDPSYISPWTALGGPIVTQPLGRDAKAMPICMLVCGAPGNDRALARTAQRIDAALA